MSVAETRLKKIVGVHSPEVAPRPILRRTAEILTGFTIGHRLNRHGIVYGLDYGFKALGEATNVPAIKDYSQQIARGVSTIGSIIGLLILRGKWSRLITGGIFFENVEGWIDMGIEAVTKAVGGGGSK